MKLYTAEWNNGSRGYKLSDPATYRFLEEAQKLGIKNIHVHKGPTIWPLDKDAFDVSDVDHAATDFPDLNFIVEHVGLPRIEDFCFMATQEPNVYAGLSVVIGGLMHARPKFFAKVMGELLFWVGEDKMTFGSDYGIWEPKWQVEGFVDWQMPDDDELSDYAKLDHRDQEEDPRPQRRQALRHPGPGRVPGARAGRRARRAGRREAGLRGMSSATDAPASLESATATGWPARYWRRWRRCATRSSTSPSPPSGSSRPAPCRRRGRRKVRLRLPTYFCAPNFAFLMVADAYDAVSGGARVCSRAEVMLDDHFASDAINAGVAARAGFVASFDGEAADELDDLRATFLRKAVLAGTDLVCRPLVDAGSTPADLAALTLGATPASPELDRLRQRRRTSASPPTTTAPCSSTQPPAKPVAADAMPLHLRRARLTRTGIDANTSICSGMLESPLPDDLDLGF